MPDPKDNKVYVKVTAVFDEDGKMMPTELLWEDGTTYYIQKVVDVRSAVARKVGGLAERYTVIIQGRESYLFFEPIKNAGGCLNGRWFVERK